MDLLIPEVTIEECAEVIQAISKIQRFGPECEGYENKKELAKEVGQLMFMLQSLRTHWELDGDIVWEAFNDKNKALRYYAQFNTCNQEVK